MGASDWKPVPVDVRIVASTNKGLDEQICSKQFRDDLYYRLNTTEINIPPLYLRPADLPVLLYAFITEYNKDEKTSIAFVTQGLLDELFLYRWPGNVRELQSRANRACNIASGSADAETLKGLDLLSEIPQTYVERAKHTYKLAHNEKIPVADLRCFDAYAFMAERDRHLAARSRGLWSMERRFEVLRQGHVPDSQTPPVESPTVTTQPLMDAVYNRPFDELRRDYASWLINRYGNANKASKVARVSNKTIAGWEKLPITPS